MIGFSTILPKPRSFFFKSLGALFGLSILIFLSFTARALPLTADSQSRTQAPWNSESTAIDANPLSLAWKMKLKNDFYDGIVDSAQTTKLSTWIKGSYKIFYPLRVRAELGGTVGTGRSQSRFGDFTPNSGLNIGEAVLNFYPWIYHPWLQFEANAGAVNVNTAAIPTILGDHVFPGLSQSLTFKNPNSALYVSLEAVQAIPTSTTLSSRAVDQEATPEFYKEQASVGLQWKGVLQGSVNYQRLRFLSLPSAVALDSSLFGNRRVHLAGGPSAAQFWQDFDIDIYGGQLDWRINSYLSLDSSFYTGKNRNAPESYNETQFAASHLNIVWGEFRWVAGYGTFFTESDVTPAYYNSSSLGHNNREGDLYTLSLSYKKFKLTGGYSNSQLINISSTQNDQKLYFIKLETSYDQVL